MSTMPQVIGEKNTLGILGLVASVVGLLTMGFVGLLGMICPFALVVSVLAVRRPPRGAAIGGIALGLLGTILFAVFALPRLSTGVPPAFEITDTVERRVASRSEQDTFIFLDSVAELLDERRGDNGEAPSLAAGEALMSGRQDSWLTTIRYAPLKDKKFEVRSAGPDRQFDTEDDIVVVREP